MYTKEQILTTEEILATLREIKPRLATEYAVKNIGLFGSFSTGYADENSDIDLLVELREPIGWRFLTLEIYLEDLFGRKIDLVTPNALKKQIRDGILEEVVYA